MIMAKEPIRSGVSTYPRLSMTELRLTVNSQIITQEMILKIGRDIPGRNVLAVEYDSAMHLGIAPNDPIALSGKSCLPKLKRVAVHQNSSYTSINNKGDVR